MPRSLAIIYVIISSQTCVELFIVSPLFTGISNQFQISFKRIQIFFYKKIFREEEEEKRSK